MDNKIVKFEDKNVEIIIENDEPLFEIYSTGMALGQVKEAKGKKYPHKERIDKNLKNAEIVPTIINGKCYTNHDDLMNLISITNTKNKINFVNWLNKNGYIKEMPIITYKRKEIKFYELLKRVMMPIGYTVVPQYHVLNYRIDFYIKELNIAIEYDENNHNHYNYEDEEIREDDIKNILGCTIIRLSDNHSDEYNIGIVLKGVLNVITRALLEKINDALIVSQA